MHITDSERKLFSSNLNALKLESCSAFLACYKLVIRVF